MNSVMKNMAFSMPGMKKFVKKYKTVYPPGHYYSPIPDMNESQIKSIDLYPETSTGIPGIDLNDNEQFDLLNEFKEIYKHLPFSEEKNDKYRYYYNNPFYVYSDGIFLYSMIRYFKPNKIIEIGSGFSSALMLDARDILNEKLELTFIEPYPERLNSLLREHDDGHAKIIERPVQEVDLEIFNELGENDILFVDSSHVGKFGSDVLHILFNILPTLNKNVLIHIHDVFYPFEYPMEWILKGRYWNESYFLHAFLQYNSKFKILLFNSYVQNQFESFFKENMPLCLKNFKKTVRGSGSIWLKKVSF